MTGRPPPELFNRLVALGRLQTIARAQTAQNFASYHVGWSGLFSRGFGEACSPGSSPRT